MPEPTQSRALTIESRIDKTATGGLVVGAGGNLAFGNANEIMECAKLMAIAHIAIPKHLRENVGACLAVAIQASEWQMSPFAVANKTYVVNDRLAYEAQLINAVILRRAPITGRFKISYTGEGPTRRCKVAATLSDGDSVDYESPQISTIPVKNSPLWKGDPDQQLFYYSSRAMCRRHFPDVILGIYTPDELEEESGIRQEKTLAAGKVGIVQAPAERSIMGEVAKEREEAPAPPVEKRQPEPVREPQPEPKAAVVEEPQDSAPTAESLYDALLAKGAAIDAGPEKIKRALVSLRYMEPSVALAKLDAKTLADFNDAWDTIAEAIAELPKK